MAKKIKRPARYFQYIDGEQKGKVVELKDIFEESGEMFYSFDDGESINTAFISPMTTSISSLKNKFLVEIQSPGKDYMWGFYKVKPQVVDLGNQETVTAPPLEDIMRRGTDKDENGQYTINGESMLGKDKLVFPMKNDIDPNNITPLPKLDWFYDPNEVEEAPVPVQQPVIQQTSMTEIFEPEGDLGSSGPMQLASEQDANAFRKELQQEQKVEEAQMSEDEKAVAILIKKTKKHDTQIPVNITMSLPAKALYLIVCDEFENGSDLFVNEVVKSLTDDQIKEAIKAGLKTAYEDKESSED